MGHHLRRRRQLTGVANTIRRTTMPMTSGTRATTATVTNASQANSDGDTWATRATTARPRNPPGEHRPRLLGTFATTARGSGERHRFRRRCANGDNCRRRERRPAEIDSDTPATGATPRRRRRYPDGTAMRRQAELCEGLDLDGDDRAWRRVAYLAGVQPLQPHRQEWWGPVNYHRDGLPGQTECINGEDLSVGGRVGCEAGEDTCQ